MRAAVVGIATVLLTRWSANRISHLLHKDQQDALYPLHVMNTVTIHHQQAVTVYAAFGIYRAENIRIVKLITYTLSSKVIKRYFLTIYICTTRLIQTVSTVSL